MLSVQLYPVRPVRAERLRAWGRVERESDEAMGAVAQHATVPSERDEMRFIRPSNETVGFGLLGDHYQSQFLGL